MANTNIKELTSRLKQADAPANSGAAKKAPAPKKEEPALEIDDIDDIDDIEDSFEGFDDPTDTAEPEIEKPPVEEVKAPAPKKEEPKVEKSEAAESEENSPDESQDIFEAYDSLFDKEDKQPAPATVKRPFKKPRPAITLAAEPEDEEATEEPEEEIKEESIPLTGESDEPEDDTSYMEEDTEGYEEEYEEYEEGEYDPNHDGYYDDVKPEIEAEIDRIDKENVMKIVGIGLAFIFITIYLVFYW